MLAAIKTEGKESPASKEAKASRHANKKESIEQVISTNACYQQSKYRIFSIKRLSRFNARGHSSSFVNKRHSLLNARLYYNAILYTYTLGSTKQLF